MNCIRRKVITRVIVFLLLGTIVNVAVAWCCVAWPDLEVVMDSDLPAKIVARFAKDVPAPWIADPDDGYQFRSFGAQYDSFHCDVSTRTDRVEQESGSSAVGGGPGVSIARLDILRAGLPMLSLQFHQFGGILRVSPPRQYWDDVKVGGRLFPIGPIWPGFAINMIFYAAILWLLFFAPGSVRRTLRRRCGLCAACAYPVGTSPVCTECGKPVWSHKSARA